MTSGILVALLLAIVIYIATRTEELVYVRRLSIRVLTATCLLQFFSQLMLNGSMLLPLQRCVKTLGFWELYLVRTGGLLVGSVVPVAGGVGVRLAYLKNRGVGYADFAWATLLSNVLALGAAAVIAAAATVVLWTKTGRPPLPVLAVAAGVLAISVAAAAGLEGLPRLTRYRKFREWNWLSGTAGWKTNPRLAGRVFGLSMVRHMLNFVTFGLLAQALSRLPADFLTGGLMYALTSPVRIVNITPANLGVTEWVVALMGRLLAFDLTTGLIAALAFRGIGLVAQGIGVLVGSAWITATRRT